MAISEKARFRHELALQGAGGATVLAVAAAAIFAPPLAPVAAAAGLAATGAALAGRATHEVGARAVEAVRGRRQRGDGPRASGKGSAPSPSGSSPEEALRRIAAWRAGEAKEPIGMVVRGDLDLTEAGSVPRGMHVTGSLKVPNGIRSLPPRIRVDGMLDVSNCSRLEELPNDLRLGGWLSKAGSALESKYGTDGKRLRTAGNWNADGPFQRHDGTGRVHGIAGPGTAHVFPETARRHRRRPSSPSPRP